MQVSFSLEGAKQEMGIPQVIEETVTAAREAYLTDHSASQLHHLSADRGALWPKIDHLTYLPLLGLRRARDLYYYQGEGLRSVYGYTYKYLTLEHFLGQLTRVQVGASLAERLARTYVQAWYPDDSPLTVFADWHIKPHWTKTYSHTGHVTMWGRTMPGTKQLIVNGPQGRLLGGWNYPIDAHLTHVLVDLEAALENTLERTIACSIVDGEGGGLPLAERYTAAERNYISILPRQHSHRLVEFDLVGTWQPVKGDADREAVFARWVDAKKVAEDPRLFVLMRPLGEREPTRIYAGRFAEQMTATLVPWMHRRRWACNELRIRDLIQGANLNCNYGYAATQVPNRTRQRQWEAAQNKVTVTERQLANQRAPVHNLRHRLADLQHTHAQQLRKLQRQLLQQRQQLRKRQRSGKATTRCQQRVRRLCRERIAQVQRFQKRQRTLFRQLHQHRAQSHVLRRRLRSRIVARDGIDTPTMCRERDLEKDQIMLNLQMMLANLHDWAAAHYFAPEWQRLSLDKATQMIYRKAGQVAWYHDRIEVVLEPYRYRDQQCAMETTCTRFNAANLRWRDGRLLRISVQCAD
jgi:hypothetical protein